jgi:opacity protein-like surface antigen
MRKLLIAAPVWIALTGSAAAQTAAPQAPPQPKGYAEVVAQSAFGNVTTQSYGGEVGITIARRLNIFFEGGKVRDTAPNTLNASAQSIAGAMTSTQGAATASAKQPATFGLAGLRYPLSTHGGKVEPYILGGAGVAQVTREVVFTVGGSDVTNNMAQYGVVLGSDLAGSEKAMMVSMGAGLMWPVLRHVVLDFQYRYGHIFSSEAINVSRAGIGIGVRF